MSTGLAALEVCFRGATHAQVLFSGRCPTPTLQADFDISRYMGRWYEMERYFAVFEIGSTCVTADYTLQEGGSVLVNNTGFYSIFNSYTSTVGDAVGTDPGNPAKLGVRFSTMQPRGDYWVISTDYDSYTVVWSCSERSIPFLRLKWNTQLLWILTREQAGIRSDVRDGILSMLRGYGINTDKLSPTDQNNCP